MIQADVPIEVVAEIGSTSEALKQRAAVEPGELALLARRQSAGHGRLGRPWRSVEGNLHLSVLLRPRAVVPGHWSLLAAVALAETALAYAPDLRLKWPNDLVRGGGKVAGILLEVGADAAAWLVIGFGVNLVVAPDDLGRPTATLDAAPDAERFAAALLRQLSEWRGRYEREGFDPVRSAWLQLGPAWAEALVVTLGVTRGERRIEGGFAGIRDDGALLLDGPSGVVAVIAGDVASAPGP